MRTSFPLGLLVILACGVHEHAEPPFDAIGASQDEIVGGVLDNADPATVSLATGFGGHYQHYCTGTLVAPKTVVTAAHCINSRGTQANYFVNFGTYSAAPTKSVRVASQLAHPAWVGNGSHDFGVIQLQTAVTDVTPIEMNATPLTQADVGRPIRHAGYGITSGSGFDSGTKREVTFEVRQITPSLIESGSSGMQTCSGDSGGPGLMLMPDSSLEKLVGVVSFGDQTCSMFGFDGRLDIDLAWIKQTMSPWELPSCATDSKCVAGCTPVDQDCICVADGACSPDCADLLKDPDCPRDCVTNGICSLRPCPHPDPDCVPEGGSCVTAGVCLGRQCVTDPQHAPAKYCSVLCGPQSPGCPSGMECNDDQICRLVQRPVVQPGERCVEATDLCAGENQTCTGPSGGITRCVQGCVVASDCPPGNGCEGSASGRRFCRPPEAELRFNNIVLPRVANEGQAAQTGCTTSGSVDFSLLGLMLGALGLRRKRARA